MYAAVAHSVRRVEYLLRKVPSSMRAKIYFSFHSRSLILFFFFFSKQGLGVFFFFASLVFVYNKKTKPNASNDGSRKCRRFEAQATVPFFLGFVFWMFLVQMARMEMDCNLKVLHVYCREIAKN